MRISGIIMATVFLLLFLPGCRGKDVSGQEGSNGADTLKVVTLYGPLSYFDYRGEPMGMDYENVRRFAQEEGYVLKIEVADNINHLIEKLRNGEAQLAAYPVPIISEYKNDLIYCGPREVTYQLLVQKDVDGKVKDVTELIGKEIVVEADSKYYYRLKNLDNELGGGIVITTVSNDTIDTEGLIGMVENNEIGFTITDSEIAMLNKVKYKDLDMTLHVSLEQAGSWAVSKKDEILAGIIDNWEKKDKDSPVVKEIYKRYYDTRSEEYGPSDLSYFLNRQNESGVSAYDAIFKKYAATAGVDWEMLAAIAYCESGFNSQAVSKYGATGLMQVMPIGAESVGVEAGELSNPDSNVKAASKILANISRSFEKKVGNPEERIKFILASYNSGIGHIYDAMYLTERQGLDPEKWTGNVSVGLLLKSRSEYYTDPGVRNGYFRGRETSDFVEKVIKTYQYIKNLTQE